MKTRFIVSIVLAAVLVALMSVEAAARGGGPKPPPGHQPSQQRPPPAQPSKQPPEKPPEQPIFDPSDPLDEIDSEQSTKSAVPDDDAQQAATKLVKEVYGDEYKDAKTPEQKKALGCTLLRKAIETDKDLTGRYVLLRLSRDIATQATDGTTAFRAIAEMAKTFTIDALDMKATALRKLSAAIRTVNQHKAIAEKAMAVADKAIAKENFPLAKQLNDLALQEARNAKKPQLVVQATKRISDIERTVASFEAAQAAAKVLDQKPDDPQANLAVGQYKCFVKADWEHGLPMLALGSDAGLRAVAAKELEGATSTEAQVALGDEWWDLAEKENSTLKEQLQGRAAYLYHKALPGLSGLTKDRIDKRLGSLTEQSVEHPSSAVVQQPARKRTSLGEHNSWTVPYIWTEQVQRYKTVIQYSPGSGHNEAQVPYMATVRHRGTKTVKAKVVSYNFNTGDVVLKISGEKEEVVRTFRYAALGEDDKKYLDSVKKQQKGQ